MEHIQHFSHIHRLAFHEFYKGTDYPVFCFACCEVISGPAYVCELNEDFTCLLYCLHKSCAELPGKIQQHTFHSQHPLTATGFRSSLGGVDTSYGFICDGCRHYSWGFKYRCVKCNFNLDAQCVSKHEGQALLKDVAVEVSYHTHRLQLFHYRSLLLSSFYDDIFCLRCLKGFRDSAYACTKCQFFIHKHCLDIPRRVKSPIHPGHLQLSTTRFNFNWDCRACGSLVYRIGLSPLQKDRIFHIRCGEQNTKGLRAEFHCHNMFYVHIKAWSCCALCEDPCEGDIYRCIKCGVNVHLECIPLPSLVEHVCHDHPLVLTNSFIPHNELGEYLCDVCERKEHIERYVYFCKKCQYIAHVECVNSEEYPPPKVLEYLVPRRQKEGKTEGKTNKSEKESDEDDKAEQQNNIDDNADKLEEDIDEGHEMDKKEGQSDSEEDCSLEELEKRMTDIKKKMDALTLELKIVQEKHAKKLH